MTNGRDKWSKVIDCSICDMIIPSSTTLLKHMADEHGVARFECPTESCDFETNQMAQLISHIAKWHAKKPALKVSDLIV